MSNITDIALQSGATIPQVGLGTWKADEPGQTYEAVRSAIKLGYRHFDCAPGYGNEKEIGDALVDAMHDEEVTREELFITSKLWNAHHFPEDVMPSLKQTLADLKLDYLDLYLMHWPVALKKGVGFPEKGDDFVSLDDLPLEKTWEAMEEAHIKGLVKDLGVSNFSAKKLHHLKGNCLIQPIMNQVEMHPYLQQQELIDYCHSQGIAVTAYAPLGSGDRPELLTSENEPTLLDHPLIQSIANEHSVTPAQVLIAWGLQRNIVMIPKSANPERQQLNLNAQEVNLTTENMADIQKLDLNYRYLAGEFWALEGSPYTLENLWDEPVA
ncbi:MULTISPECIES: aldo/keto reductase [unclassified Vibrio]|jgi:alcohol dehydrogenase (NADP+)|uniref:aldo/keto reductase n=1 Tax=unclassified Vibrio TaxID=2614977 RepID=UPI00159CF2D5|nr:MULTISPECIES: aldo/keto reductase [unclassified Vibrio]NVN80567.1 aldo/keto reductase [Vibrio sp. Scap16]QLE95618.1 aldo/keto reductase [Vibrio sp. Scap24]